MHVRTYLAQDRVRLSAVVNFVVNLRVPQNSGTFLISCVTNSFSRITLHHQVH